MKLIRAFVSLAALLLFARYGLKHGADVFWPIFDLAGGDAALLSLSFAAFLAATILGAWAWSAHERRRYTH